jgi:hypothetical protein
MASSSGSNSRLLYLPPLKILSRACRSGYRQQSGEHCQTLLRHAAAWTVRTAIPHCHSLLIEDCVVCVGEPPEAVRLNDVVVFHLQYDQAAVHLYRGFWLE